MTDGKLNQTAQRQQEDRKKRLAQALRANMALRKNRVRTVPAPKDHSAPDDVDTTDGQGN